MDFEQVQEQEELNEQPEVAQRTMLELTRTAIVNKTTGKVVKSSAGNTCYEYAVHGTILDGRVINANFVPKDKDGYKALDIVYAYAAKYGQPVYLAYTNGINVDSVTGRRRSTTSYQAVVYYEDGKTKAANLRPKMDSDKSMLNFILDELGLPNVAM